jgi:hypothetical protein
MKHPGLLLLAGLCVAGFIDALALTATSGETDVILHVGSDHEVGHPAMHLRYAGPSGNWALLLEDLWTTPQPPAPGRTGGKERSIAWASVKEGRALPTTSLAAPRSGAGDLTRSTCGEVGALFLTSGRSAGTSYPNRKGSRRTGIVRRPPLGPA